MRHWAVNLDKRISHYDLLMLGDRFACIDVLALYGMSEADAELLLDWRAGRRHLHLKDARLKGVKVRSMEVRLGQALVEAMELGDALDHLMPTFKTRAALRRAGRSSDKMDRALRRLVDLDLCADRNGTFKLHGRALVLGIFANRTQGYSVTEVAKATGMSSTWCRRALHFLEGEGWLTSTVRPKSSGGAYEWRRVV